MIIRLFVFFLIGIYSTTYGVDYIQDQDKQRCEVFKATHDENKAQPFTRNIAQKLTDSRQVEYNRTATLDERQKIYKAMMGSVIIHGKTSYDFYKKDSYVADGRYNSHFEAIGIIDRYTQKLWEKAQQNLYIYNLDEICQEVSHKTILTEHFVTWFYEALTAYKKKFKGRELVAEVVSASAQSAVPAFPYNDEFKATIRHIPEKLGQTIELSDHKMMKADNVIVANLWAPWTRNGFNGQNKDPSAKERWQENVGRINEQLQISPTSFALLQEIGIPNISAMENSIRVLNQELNYQSEFELIHEVTGKESFANGLIYNKKIVTIIPNSSNHAPELDSVSFKANAKSGVQAGRYLLRAFQANSEKWLVINAHLAWEPNRHELVDALNNLAIRYFNIGFSKVICGGDWNIDLTGAKFKTSKVYIGTNSSLLFTGQSTPVTNDAILIFEKDLLLPLL